MNVNSEIFDNRNHWNHFSLNYYFNESGLFEKYHILTVNYSENNQIDFILYLN